jgi:hypothetical protein
MASVMDEARATMEGVLNLLHTQNQHLEKIAAQTIAKPKRRPDKRRRFKFTGEVPASTLDASQSFKVPPGQEYYIKNYTIIPHISATNFELKLMLSQIQPGISTALDDSGCILASNPGLFGAFGQLSDCFIPENSEVQIAVVGTAGCIWTMNLDVLMRDTMVD